jgi:hypothetical protein
LKDRDRAVGHPLGEEKNLPGSILKLAALTQTLIQMALERDPVAMRLSMERILPPRKDRPVSFQLRPIGSARDAAEAQSDIAAAVSSGRMTPAEGADIRPALMRCMSRR